MTKKASGSMKPAASSAAARKKRFDLVEEQASEGVPLRVCLEYLEVLTAFDACPDDPDPKRTGKLGGADSYMIRATAAISRSATTEGKTYKATGQMPRWISTDNPENAVGRLQYLARKLRELHVDA